VPGDVYLTFHVPIALGIVARAADDRIIRAAMLDAADQLQARADDTTHCPAQLDDVLVMLKEHLPVAPLRHDDVARIAQLAAAHPEQVAMYLSMEDSVRQFKQAAANDQTPR
jgi:hypothetical protein